MTMRLTQPIIILQNCQEYTLWRTQLYYDNLSLWGLFSMAQYTFLLLKSIFIIYLYKISLSTVEMGTETEEW